MKKRLVVLLVEALMNHKMTVLEVKTVQYDLHPGIWSRRVTLGYKLSGLPDFILHEREDRHGNFTTFACSVKSVKFNECCESTKVVQIDSFEDIEKLMSEKFEFCSY